MINREIKDLQPDYYDGVYEFDQIAKAEEYQTDEFDKWLIKQLNNLYATNADLDGIRLFESAYGIAQNESDDIETRRRRVIARLVPPQAITMRFFKNLLDSLNLSVQSDVDCIKSIYRATVDLDTFTQDQIKELNDLMDTYLPSNLGKEIYRYANITSNMGSYLGIANTVTMYSHNKAKGSDS